MKSCMPYGVLQSQLGDQNYAAHFDPAKENWKDFEKLMQKMEDDCCVGGRRTKEDSTIPNAIKFIRCLRELQ